MEELIIPITVGLTEVVKRVGLSSRFLPLIAIALGVVLTGFYTAFDQAGIVQGVIFGLTSVGLFSGVKSVAGK